MSEAGLWPAWQALLPGMVCYRRMDERGTILAITPNCEKWLGIKATLLVGWSYFDLIGVDEQVGVAKLWREQRPFSHHYRLTISPQTSLAIKEKAEIGEWQGERCWVCWLEASGEVGPNKMEQPADTLLAAERNRLARELHDSVTQSLYSLTLFAEAGRRMAVAGDEGEVIHFFTRVQETGQQALKEMRLLVHRLRPSVLAQKGLVGALQHRLNAVEGRAGVQHQLVVRGDIVVRPKVEEAIYYIVQEALNNGLKHARALVVEVGLEMVDKHIVAWVWDDGVGFDLAEATEADGLGLTSMQERAEQLGGVVVIVSPAEPVVVTRKRESNGALVKVTIPCE
ncbi:MAG TPA: sensor histidine kinase [Anaerolineae bacterium]|nr:sensor histidine kinase [Anaerolineae bacterium]